MTRIPSITALIASALLSTAAVSQAATTKSEYDASKDRAEAQYKAADKQCDSLSGNPKDICQAEAKAARVKSDAMAEADYKNTPKARADAMEKSADADYDVAKQRCDAKTGNEKDVCIKEAKAEQVRVKGDAKVAAKSSAARSDANEDRRDADYKVAMERCDALAGGAKDGCQKNAKATFHK